MKILFFSRLFYPHIGGVEKHVLKISNELIKNGDRVIVITEGYSKKLPRYEEFNKIKIFRIPISKNENRKKFVIWKWLLRHRELVMEADVVHCHDVFYWYLPFRVLFPFKKVYTTFHGYEGDNIPNWKSKMNHTIAEKLSYGNVCVGEFLTKWYKTNASFITYGGITPHKTIKPSFKNFHHATFVGRLEPETGFLEYLKALEKLSQYGIRINLAVFGDGSQKYLIEKYAKKINIRFYGFVENMDKWLWSSDLIFTSRYLGMLEALNAKKYVIAVYNNEIKEDYLKMSPFSKYVVLAENHEEIANSIKNSNEKKVKSLVDKGFSWASGQTWEKLTKQYIRLWS